MATDEKVATTLEVRVILTDAHYLWLRDVAAQEMPQPTTSQVLERFIDQAIVDTGAAAQRRAEQLEIYRGSGYAEHHPDYPEVAGDSRG